MLFNAGGGANGTDLLLEVTYTPARHGEQLFETLAGGWGGLTVLTERQLEAFLRAVGVGNHK